MTSSCRGAKLFNAKAHLQINLLFLTGSVLGAERLLSFDQHTHPLTRHSQDLVSRAKLIILNWWVWMERLWPCNLSSAAVGNSDLCSSQQSRQNAETKVVWKKKQNEIEPPSSWSCCSWGFFRGKRSSWIQRCVMGLLWTTQTRGRGSLICCGGLKSERPAVMGAGGWKHVKRIQHVCDFNTLNTRLLVKPL